MSEAVIQKKPGSLQSKINSILGITERAGYKFITPEMRSMNGSQQWELGKWYKCSGQLITCYNGFHDTETPLQSLDFVYGDVWCITETRGASTERDGDGKCAHREMRIIRILEAKPILVKFAVLCARRCLHNYEEKYPDDKRPRLAIEVVEEWLKIPNKKSESAWSAARSARSVARSARSAAWSAESAAASAAALAARSAAWSAESAAALAAALAARSAARSAAESAAWSAARSAVRSAAWSAESAAASAAALAARSAAWSAESVRSARSVEKKWQNETLLGLILEEVSKPQEAKRE